MQRPVLQNQNTRASSRRSAVSGRVAALSCALAVLFGAAMPAAAQTVGSTLQRGPSVGRASINQKGSLLFFPHVEVKWDANGTLRQDMFIELTNDYADAVHVQFYLINGDAPLEAVYENDSKPPRLIERAHPGWNWVDVQFRVTRDQPVYWSSSTGMPVNAPRFDILDPASQGFPAGRPDTDPDNIGGRVVRGYVVGWAVNAEGQEISWNHLSGGATVIDYTATAAWEYEPWAFQTRNAAHGTQPESCLLVSLESGQCVDRGVFPGDLLLDGFEYDACPGRLQVQFPAASASVAVTGIENGPHAYADPRLTLAIVRSDLRQDNEGPITTKAKFDIWNENEVRFSGTEKCVTCWDWAPLAQYVAPSEPNHFLYINLQTPMGRARINGIASTVCPSATGSKDAALLGVLNSVLRFDGLWGDQIQAPVPPRIAKTGVILGGQGEEQARIRYDIIAGPQEAHGGN